MELSNNADNILHFELEMYSSIILFALGNMVNSHTHRYTSFLIIILPIVVIQALRE